VAGCATGENFVKSLADKWELEEDSGRYRVPGIAMAKRSKKRDYGDKTRIDMNQPYQVAYWKQRFGVSEQEFEACRARGRNVSK
jgi:hypothetical protein